MKKCINRSCERNNTTRGDNGCNQFITETMIRCPRFKEQKKDKSTEIIMCLVEHGKDDLTVKELRTIYNLILGMV